MPQAVGPGPVVPLLSVPTAGRAIQKALAPWANPLFDCYSELKRDTPLALRSELGRRFGACYAQPQAESAQSDRQHDTFELTCAAALSVLLIARLTLRSPDLSFDDAEAWFLGP